MNVPNSLTVARVILAPVLAVVIQPSVDAALAPAVFALGMTTDFADGYLARTRGLVTRFGTLMDPIADKLFIGTALVGLAATSRIALWIVAVVFARELLVTAMRLVARRDGVIIPANALGKAKTALQALAVFLLLTIGPGVVPVDALVYVMAGITVLSGAVYVAGYFRGRRIAMPRVRSSPRIAAG